MNPRIQQLQAYPFEKMKHLLEGVLPSAHQSAITLAIGEPQHPCPDFILQTLIDNIDLLARYPSTRGTLALRQSIADWLGKRFQLPENSLDPDSQILPVNGTREALFSFAQAVVKADPKTTVVMPNPFYQIYEGAALLAGAKPDFIPCLADNDFQPNFHQVSADRWQACQLLYLCSPGNPTGAVLDIDTLQYVIKLADEFDFIIASDECYSELYLDENHPSVGLLQAAASMGRTDYKRCVVFNSLSKRSNVAGMRSGFVAGDEAILQQFFQYRTYHGCAMALPNQAASTVAWADEQHVIKNRTLYRDKFTVVSNILEPVLDVDVPPASFYLWPKTPISDEQFAHDLFEQQNVKVVAGSYLSRSVNGQNPGQNRVRLALVAPVEQCREAALRMATFLS